MMHGCLQRVNSSGSIKSKTETILFSGLVNFMLKLWNIKEICNTLTVSSIVSIVVCGKIWSKVFREASVNNLSTRVASLNSEPN